VLRQSTRVVASISAYGIAPGPGDPTSMRAFALKYLSQAAPGEFTITSDSIPAAVVNQPFAPFALTASGECHPTSGRSVPARCRPA